MYQEMVRFPDAVRPHAYLQNAKRVRNYRKGRKILLLQVTDRNRSFQQEFKIHDVPNQKVKKIDCETHGQSYGK